MRDALKGLFVLVWIALVYVLDRVTGIVPDLSVLYLVPIVLVAYWYGRWWAIGVAVLALASELAAHPAQHYPAVLIPSLTHTATYVFAALITSQLRSQLQTIRQLEARRDSDMELARRVQSVTSEVHESTDPRFDVAAKSIPARELGGDQVFSADVVHGLFVYIADISGKGVSAALFAALLEETVRMALEASDDPQSVIQHVNTRMYKALPSESFVTMLCCLVQEDEVLYVNAGHEPGLVRDPGGLVVRELTSEGGLPVGVVEDLRIQASSASFGPGHALLCFSDGITDGPGFGRELVRVRDFFERDRHSTSADVVDAVIREAKGDADILSDDMSVLVVRRI